MESETTKPRSFENIIKFLSLLYVILTFLGLIYNYVYYKSYGIIITEYIDLGEALFLFTPFLKDNGFVIASIIAALVVFARKYFIREFEIPGNQKVVEQYLKVMSIIVIAIAVVFLICYFLIKNITFLVISLSLLFFVLIIVFEFLYNIFERNYFRIPNFVKEVAPIIATYFIFILAGSYSVVEFEKKQKDIVQVQIIFKNGEQNNKSDSSNRYLGRTNKYIFFHDYANHRSKVINVDDVKEFIIQQ